MSKARVAVLKVITKELTVTATATQYGYSRRHLQRLLARYREAGLDAVDPRSRRPLSNSAATPDTVRERIIDRRLWLAKEGLDNGPATIAWHLEQEGHRPPAVSTIRRILHAQGLIEPEPRKRPRSSYRSFVAAQPNETTPLNALVVSRCRRRSATPRYAARSSAANGPEWTNWCITDVPYVASRSSQVPCSVNPGTVQLMSMRSSEIASYQKEPDNP
jgi:transposase